MSIFRDITRRLFRPHTLDETPSRPSLQIEQHVLALAVGAIALSMPFILILLTWLIGASQQESISDYYYVPYVSSVFEGQLFFVGLFMMAYAGHTQFDWYMGKLGGVCALLVAIFPTDGEQWQDKTDILRVFARPHDPSQLPTTKGVPFTEDGNLIYELDGGILDVPLLGTHNIHIGAALIFFLILAIYCLVSFRRNNGEGVDAAPTPHLSFAKLWRNRIYTTCGLTILMCIGVLIWLGWTETVQIVWGMDLFFWAEAVALIAFGLSWLVKGRLILSER